MAVMLARQLKREKLGLLVETALYYHKEGWSSDRIASRPRPQAISALPSNSNVDPRALMSV